MLLPNCESTEFNDNLILDGINVEFLLIYPVTLEEMNYRREKGIESIGELLLNSDVGAPFDPYRKSLV